MKANPVDHLYAGIPSAPLGLASYPKCMARADFCGNLTIGLNGESSIFVIQTEYRIEEPGHVYRPWHYGTVQFSSNQILTIN